jgi:hypothetical protein
MSYSFPIVLTKEGLQPQSTDSLRNQLLTNVAATNPGYTATLPGSLIEDISSTQIGGIALCDSAKVDLINSMTPYGANEFLLNQLGNLYGISRNQPTNTSVYVQFSGAIGFVISQGFIVSDGSYQYVVQEAGIIGTGGVTPPMYAIATVTGTWAVPINTVNQLITSVPGIYTVTVNNTVAGLPGLASVETEESFRARVLMAGTAPATGMASYLKTLLSEVPGVQANLVSILQQPGGGWSVICGGGDPYQVAYAIYTALFDISTLVGSSLAVSGITQASNGVVTTNLAHGFSTGQSVTLSNVVGMTGINGMPFTATVLTPKTFRTGIDTTGFGAYTSGGTLSPNLRNEVVSILDFPDTYLVPFVLPPQQIVTMTVTWATISPNYISPAAIAGLVQPSMVAYINAITVGQPINILQLEDAFTSVLPSAISESSISLLTFDVYINGIAATPVHNLIYGDPESYMFSINGGITVAN